MVGSHRKPLCFCGSSFADGFSSSACAGQYARAAVFHTAQQCDRVTITTVVLLLTEDKSNDKYVRMLVEKASRFFIRR